MRITDALRDRGALKALLDPADARFETGDDESRQKARAQWHRDRLISQVLTSPLPELDRDDLVFRRFGRVKAERERRQAQPRPRPAWMRSA